MITKYLFFSAVGISIIILGACTPSHTALVSRHRDSASDSELPDTLVEGAAGLCGNGVLELPEECDDGNRLDCDGCSRDCMRETESCGHPDANTDPDSEISTPEPPVPLSDPMPVEQNPEEAIPGGDWLHILWTGEQFSFIFGRQCTPDSSDRCLCMRRYGTVKGYRSSM
jgi:cysteine-rich repeat protein